MVINILASDMTTTSENEKIDRQALTQLIIGACLVSFSPIIVKLSSLPSTIEAFYRMLFGGIALCIIALITRAKFWKGWRPIFYALACGFLFSGDLYFWQLSIEHVGPGLATILGNMQVFILTLVGVLVYRESVTIRTIIAFPLVLLGLSMLIGLKWDSLTASYRIGVYLGLIGALFYGAFVLILRKAQKEKRHLPPTTNLIMICIASVIILGILSFFRGEPLLIRTTSNWLWMILYGVLCQAFAWLLITKGLPKIPVSYTGFLLLLQPSLAFIWDILIFKRPTPPVEIVGAMITIFAIYLSTSGRKKLRTRVNA